LTVQIIIRFVSFVHLGTSAMLVAIVCSSD